MYYMSIVRACMVNENNNKLIISKTEKISSFLCVSAHPNRCVRILSITLAVRYHRLYADAHTESSANWQRQTHASMELNLIFIFILHLCCVCMGSFVGCYIIGVAVAIFANVNRFKCRVRALCECTAYVPHIRYSECVTWSMSKMKQTIRFSSANMRVERTPPPPQPKIDFPSSSPILYSIRRRLGSNRRSFIRGGTETSNTIRLPCAK